MLVKDVMSSNVATVGPNTSVAVAARAMRHRVVGCLPVLEQGQVIGMVTDRDLVERALAEGLDAHATAVRSVMSAVRSSARLTSRSTKHGRSWRTIGSST